MSRLGLFGLICLCLLGMMHRMNQPAPIFGHAQIKQPRGLIVAPSEPKQILYRASNQPQSLEFNGAQLKPLASFEFDSRLLSTVWYGRGRESDFSQVDLGLSWGRMSDSANIEALSWDHSARFFMFRFLDQPPVPLEEITRSIANLHVIAVKKSVLDDIAKLKYGSRVIGRGQLVEVSAPDGWRWVSSLRRDDDGNGACEVILLESIRAVP